MNEEQNKTMNPIVEEESSIDFGKIYKDILRHKRLYFIVLPIAFVLAAIYALSLPNFYNCTVKLSPEMSGSKASAGSLASLASSFGVNLGSSGAGTEALFPTLYPDLMNSVDFKTSLFPVKVKLVVLLVVELEAAGLHVDQGQPVGQLWYDLETHERFFKDIVSHFSDYNIKSLSAFAVTASSISLYVRFLSLA